MKNKMAGIITPAGSTLWRGLRVGLLGGSFNPAHAGHRHISLLALQYLQLDAVWWLVSPQNPLKSAAGMASQHRRMASAIAVANHPRIHVSDIETTLHTRYTVDTVAHLQAHFAATRFVWLMGSDNLRQFHRWKNWQRLFDLLPVCVIARPPAGDLLRACPASMYARPFTLPSHMASTLPDQSAPAMLLLPTPLNDLSSTALRATGAWR